MTEQNSAGSGLREALAKAVSEAFFFIFLDQLPKALNPKPRLKASGIWVCRRAVPWEADLGQWV